MNPYIIPQICKQFFGLIYAPIRGNASLPYPSNYSCKGKYILPFEGCWTVVNGGVTEEYSHSWDILTQRYAYDFLVLDGNGKTYSGDFGKGNEG